MYWTYIFTYTCMDYIYTCIQRITQRNMLHARSFFPSRDVWFRAVRQVKAPPEPPRAYIDRVHSIYMHIYIYICTLRKKRYTVIYSHIYICIDTCLYTIIYTWHDIHMYPRRLRQLRSWALWRTRHLKISNQPGWNGSLGSTCWLNPNIHIQSIHIHIYMHIYIYYIILHMENPPPDLRHF